MKKYQLRNILQQTARVTHKVNTLLASLVPRPHPAHISLPVFPARDTESDPR